MVTRRILSFIFASTLLFAGAALSVFEIMRADGFKAVRTVRGTDDGRGQRGVVTRRVRVAALNHVLFTLYLVFR